MANPAPPSPDFGGNVNALQLVNELLSRFSLSEVSSFGGVGSDSAIALRKVNLAIQQICSVHDFKWLHKTSAGTITAVAGTSTYSLASDVNELLAAKHEYQDGGSIQVVDRATLELYRPDRAATSDRNTPTHMALFGKTQSGVDWLWQVELWPVPDTNFGGQTITYFYTITPADLSATTDVPIIPSQYHWLIVEAAEMLWRRGPLRVGGDQNQVDLYSASMSNFQAGILKLIASDQVTGTEEGHWEPAGRPAI